MSTPTNPGIKPPKTSKEIMVRDEMFLIDQGTREPVPPKIVSLATKIDEYILKVGHSNTNVMSLVVQLLTIGKVRLDFRDYTERLELLNLSDIMSRPQAAAVFDQHLASANKNDDVSMMTQKIVIQPPRVNLPKR
jgi:hypothetical protein